MSKQDKSKPVLPSGGGSFVRNSDGSLTEQKPPKQAEKPEGGKDAPTKTDKEG